MELNKIYNEDCLVGMDRIPDGSVDMILTDLPYGTTACSWDEVIPFEPMWEQFERVIKDNGAIVLTGAEPFSSKLRLSKVGLFRYDWVWEKTIAPNFMMSGKQPLKKHEIVSVFYKKQPTYNPQMEEGEPYKDNRINRYANTEEASKDTVYGGLILQEKKPLDNKGTRYPSSVQLFSNGNNHNIHPTQKPVELFEYLIKAYTNKGETVLDATIGSGTTAIACLNTDRQYIGFELDKEYFRLANERIKNHVIQDTLF